MGNTPPLIFGAGEMTIQDICDMAANTRHATLSEQESFTSRIRAGSQFLDELLQKEGQIYGVTTGYGDSCTTEVPADLVPELPLHLQRFHGCGLGNIFDPATTRAIMAARISSLTRGYSGVSLALLERLVLLLDKGVTPLIPEEGSVGASGDLTPLSYIAAMLVGERDVLYQGKQRPCAEVLQALGLEPLTLRPKEGLAIMNGTAVMTALACLAYQRAAYLAQLCTRLTSLAVTVLQGNVFHFDPTLFSVKPHPGQNQIAQWIHDDLQCEDAPKHSKRLQDRYSLRCAPHVIGVLQDALPWLKTTIETELNSANDNPIIDAEGGRILHGGHFYGGHIAFAMDSLKNAVANLADLMDRQMALLVDTKFNHGLPANLSGATGKRASINHGFKAVQIGLSAWTAEALKLTMPASVFSRSTECHNQDKVSMGTHAARDCLRVLTLTEQTAAGLLLALTQAYELRQRAGELDQKHLSKAMLAFIASVQEEFTFVEEDRPLESELRGVLQSILGQKWSIYSS